MRRCFSAADRANEIQRAQLELLARAGGMVVDGDPVSVAFPEAFALIKQIAAYDRQAAAYRVREAEVTGKAQRNPFSRKALERLLAAVGGSLEELRTLAAAAAPLHTAAITLAAVRVSRAAVDFCWPRYQTWEAEFSLDLRAARRTYRRSAKPSESKARSNRRKQKNEGSGSATKALAALVAHHLCHGDVCPEPIRHADLAAQAETSPASITRFLQRCFGGYAAYVRLCEGSPNELRRKLKALYEGYGRGARLAYEPAAEPHFTDQLLDEMDAKLSAPRNSLRHNALTAHGVTRTA